MTPLFDFTIAGAVPSKKNRYKIGNGRMYQDRAVGIWMESAGWQIKEQISKRKKYPFPIEQDIKLDVHFYGKKDKDVDNMLNSVMDLLQTMQIIKNDSQVKEVSARKSTGYATAGCDIKGYAI